ncbi:DUF1302 domain-containing protein [Ectopseudomonas hydrolytica]|uniref:DUF1302 domain-containing protein n=1 Tax=Ectopseudomonas hydrolytica TaxID=2493633 RepID=A0ABY5A5T2_9GAMM|nr:MULTISPECIES: DUF1302 domain-containing protein [Pseudomonas]ARS50468.1 type V secretory pathway, adhesin AidA [Pseudomonas mendocina]EJO95664.1 hypothetical protein A471_02022 [Pseudomonas mendocina DLHK]MBA4244644.1 DUF1302 domain-containing protein [Pseudomonas sp.]USR39003.1 DUF1302 domain-containing protein [Pseudomonas hydrolytica]
MTKTTPYWRLAKLPLAVSLASTLAAPAFGVTFNIGEIEGQFDSQLSVGASWAVRGADPSLVGLRNGGGASSQTGDDGRLNFKKGETFSKIFKGIHDLELKYGDTGVFVRGKYWYDFELKDESRLLYDIDDSNRKTAAQSSGVQLLDAFLYHNYTIAELPGSVRVGKQVVSWGESTFIQNSINSINPVDVAAFRRPGAEIKEGLIPVNMFYVSQSLTDNLSAEVFYQLEWDQTVLDNCGTFFALDVLADGCTDRLAVDGSDFGGPGSPRYAYLSRLGDNDARDSGQYGIALRWFSPELDTEFGFYTMNYHSRTPNLSYVAGRGAYLPGISPSDGPQFADPSIGQLHAGYYLDYAEDIRLHGMSFSTTAGSASIAGEISYRPNMPMQINTIDLTLASILQTGLAYTNSPIYTSGHAQGFEGEVLQGYVRKPLTQAQVTVTQFIDQVAGAERLTLVGEVGYSHVSNLGKNELRFGRAPEFGSGPLATPGLCETVGNSANPQECNNKGFYTTTSWGYRARAILDYNNAFAGVNLRPSLSWSHDVDGYGPTFNEGNKAISLGLDAEYQNTYTASLSYTDFFGGKYNTNIDRDFVALSFGVNF